MEKDEEQPSEVLFMMVLIASSSISHMNRVPLSDRVVGSLKKIRAGDVTQWWSA
jgi:hypothetical protein